MERPVPYAAALGACENLRCPALPWGVLRNKSFSRWGVTIPASGAKQSPPREISRRFRLFPPRLGLWDRPLVVHLRGKRGRRIGIVVDVSILDV